MKSSEKIILEEIKNSNEPGVIITLSDCRKLKWIELGVYICAGIIYQERNYVSIASLREFGKLGEKRIRKVLKSLEKKGYVKRIKKGRNVFYEPRLTKLEDLISDEEEI